MTNKEFSDKLEILGEFSVIIFKICKGDKSKIEDKMWEEFCRLCEELEEYI